MSVASAGGILAIWNDIDAQVAGDYEHWYQRQHLYERVSIPGFRYGRRYLAPDSSPRFFTFYETDAPNVLTGGIYVERLNDPTPWTQSLMPHFRNVSRTICVQARVAGDQSGGWAATVRLANPLQPDAMDILTAELGRLESWPGIARVRVWHRHETGPLASTSESALRSEPDASIGAALVVEATNRDEALSCAEALTARVAGGTGTAAVGVYQLICHIDGDEIRRLHGD